MKDEVEFLGFLITSKGLQPKTDKVETIKTWPRPTSFKSLRSMMGKFSFYRQHVPLYAEIVEPLQLLLNESQPARNSQVANDTSSQWDTIHDEALSSLKEKLAESVLLYHLSPDGTLSFMTDASDKAIGGVLHDKTKDGTSVQLAFFSRKLSVAEPNYSVFDRELLAVFAAIHKFRRYIERRHCVVYTDHKPIIASFRKQSTTLRDNVNSFRFYQNLSMIRSIFLLIQTLLLIVCLVLRLRK